MRLINADAFIEYLGLDIENAREENIGEIVTLADIDNQPPNSPLPHIYYKMCKTPEEIKEKFPYEAQETCSSCGENTDIWIETDFSFCDEYGCGMKLCPDCARELGEKIKELQSMIE